MALEVLLIGFIRRVKGICPSSRRKVPEEIILIHPFDTNRFLANVAGNRSRYVSNDKAKFALSGVERYCPKPISPSIDGDRHSVTPDPFSFPECILSRSSKYWAINIEHSKFRSSKSKPLDCSLRCST